jgi:hypothetical protein
MPAETPRLFVTMYCAPFGGQVTGLAGALVSSAAMYGPSSFWAWSFWAWLVERSTSGHRDAAWMLTGGCVVTRGANHILRTLLSHFYSPGIHSGGPVRHIS